MKATFLTITILFLINFSEAQVVPISNTSTNGCGLTIMDTGMDGESYSSNEQITMTLCSIENFHLSLYFETFDLGAGDTLAIYDGSTIDSPILGVFMDQGLGGFTIESTGNCMTLHFTSDDTEQGDFVIQSACQFTNIPPIPVVTINGSSENVFYSCSSEELLFDASSSVFGEGATVSSFQWDFGDGTYDTISWPTVTHAYQNTGAYNINLSITDNNGYTSLTDLNTSVLSSTSPIFTYDFEPSLCFDFNEFTQDSVNNILDEYLNNIEVNVENIPFIFPSGNAFHIPDNGTEVLSDAYSITGYASDSVITSYEDMPMFCINMEHSYMGDLTISFICPTGQSITVHQQGGGGTDLGEPSDNEFDAGIGYNYCWSTNASNGTWAEEATGNNTTLPSGVYSSAQDFSNLIGCPTNGIWSIQISDPWLFDDGWVFDWFVSFENNTDTNFQILPPVFGLDCDSTYLSSDYFTQNDDCTINWTQTIDEPGIYDVLLTTLNDYGCNFQDSLEFVLFDVSTPTIQLDINSNALITEEGLNNYQWFLDDQIIIGANTYIYQPLEEGNYTVVTINANDCASTSDPYFYSVESLTDNAFQNDITWYIANNELLIESRKNWLNKVQLFTSTGILIYDDQDKKMATKINLSKFSAGVYLLRINNQSRKISIVN